MENTEIERKFLVKRLPENIDTFEHREIEQGYLSTNPVVRVRREDDFYYLTYKSRGLLSHTEYNLPLNAASYQHLLEKADDLIIQKTRYRIPYTYPGSRPFTIELDMFHGVLAPLLLAEVEFDSEEESRLFVPPDWFGADVTYEKIYHNSVLSKKGLPE